MAGAFDAGSVSARLVLNLDEWSVNLEKAKNDTTSLGGAITAHKDQIEKLGKSFALVGGAIVGSLGLMLKSATDFTLEAGRMAQKTGIAVETVSGLREAASKTGVSMDTLNVGLRRFATIVSDAAGGSKTAQETLAKLGVTATDSTGKIKPMEQLLFETADKFKGMADGSDKAALAVDLFGRSGTEMILMLNKGSGGIKEFMADAKNMGLIITAEGVAKAKAFSISMQELDDAFMSIKLVIANALMPVVKSLADTFTSVGVVIRRVMEVCPPLTNVITVLVGAVGGLSTILGVVLLVSVKLIVAWPAMALAIGKMTTAVVAASAKMALSIPIYAAVLAAILAINAATNAYADSQDKQIAAIVKNGEQQGKTWAWIREIYASSNTKITQAIDSIRASGQRMGQSQEEIGDRIYNSFGKVIEQTKQLAIQTAAMAGKVKDIQVELSDKLRILTTNEYTERIFQAGKYYDDLKKKATAANADAKTMADIEKARAVEVANIKKEQSEIWVASNQKAADAVVKKIADATKKVKEYFEGIIIVQTKWASMGVQTTSTLSEKMTAYLNKWAIGFGKNLDNAKKDLKEFALISAKNFGVYIQSMQEGFSTFFSGLNQMSANHYQQEFQAMDAEYTKKKKAIEDSLLSETEKNTAYEALDKEYADKKKTLEIQQAAATKASGISQALVNTALAIVSALSTKPFIPMGLIAAAMAAAAGAIQIAVIRSAPLPAMAEGGLVNRATNVLAGEAGPEAILPMRELQRMLGISPRGGGGSKTVQVNITTVDAYGFDRLINEKLIPRLTRALNNESFTIPVKAVR